MKNILFAGMISALIISRVSAEEKDPFGSFCKDTTQTFSQCTEQAKAAYKACEAAVANNEEDSLNMVTDKYSLQYCQNTLKSLLQWCQSNCKN